MQKNINHPYNWSRFYRALGRLGPSLLLGIDDDTREIITMSSQSTDMFWSDGLEELLRMGAVDGDMREGVLSTLDVWRENVLDALESSYGIEMDWKMVCIDVTSPLIDELIEAASPS